MHCWTRIVGACLRDRRRRRHGVVQETRLVDSDGSDDDDSDASGVDSESVRVSSLSESDADSDSGTSGSNSDSDDDPLPVADRHGRDTSTVTVLKPEVNPVAMMGPLTPVHTRPGGSGRPDVTAELLSRGPNAGTAVHPPADRDKLWGGPGKAKGRAATQSGYQRVAVPAPAVMTAAEAARHIQAGTKENTRLPSHVRFCDSEKACGHGLRLPVIMRQSSLCK
jgi:hypothetical protein